MSDQKPQSALAEEALCRRAGGTAATSLLARFTTPKPGERLAELGAGCGDASLAVAARAPGVVIDGLEAQPELASAARRRGGVFPNLRMFTGDVRRPPPEMGPGSYDLVMMNPPFFPRASGRLPPDPVRAAARFEMYGGLSDFLDGAARLLKKGGRLHLVFRPERGEEVKKGLADRGLGLVDWVTVLNRSGGQAVLMLAGAIKGKGESRAAQRTLTLDGSGGNFSGAEAPKSLHFHE